MCKIEIPLDDRYWRFTLLPLSSACPHVMQRNWDALYNCVLYSTQQQKCKLLQCEWSNNLRQVCLLWGFVVYIGKCMLWNKKSIQNYITYPCYHYSHQRLLHLCQRRTNSQFLICFFRYMYNQLEVIITGRDFVGKFKET